MKQHPCHAATTARRTRAGRSAGSGSRARPTGWRPRSAAAPAPSRRCSTGSPTCSLELGLPRERRAEAVRGRARPHAPPHLRRARPARRGVPAHAAAGTDSTRPASQRWRAASSSNLAARMPRSASAASRVGRSAPHSRRPRRSGRELTDLEEEHRLPRDRAALGRSRPRDAALGAGRARSTRCFGRRTSRPAISCAG